MKQKYTKGDHVQVVKDLGPMMRHFTSDCEAIVIHSYNDKYGGGNIEDYCIHIEGRGQVSWYKEHQLKLIEADKIDLLEKWETEAKQEADMKSDLDWIFSHGGEVLDNAHGATVSALAKCFGLTNLWGGNGEGVVYHSNAMGTLDLARPFLLSGDKEGYLKQCESVKIVKQ